MKPYNDLRRVYFDHDIEPVTGRIKQHATTDLAAMQANDPPSPWGGSSVLDASCMGGQDIALVVELPASAYEQESRTPL